MPALLGIDLGTTSITAIAVDAASGNIVARATTANQAEITTPADRERGFSEWDAAKIVAAASACLKQTAARLPPKTQIAGIGLTGQQHGVLLLNKQCEPLTPLINWQDRRGDQPYKETQRSYVQEMSSRLGPDAAQRTGCRLACGFMATTLFWLAENGLLPPSCSACFLVDYFAALLTGIPPATDPTNAAGSGVFDVKAGVWAADLIGRLGLPQSLFPEVRRSGNLLGTLQPSMATSVGLAAGIPVFVGIGDHQASFIGSVAERHDSILINVGTGAQVAAYTDEFLFDPGLETRPFPRGGYLLVCPGLSGGRSYALLESFFRRVGSELLHADVPGTVYTGMNELAHAVSSGHSAAAMMLLCGT